MAIEIRTDNSEKLKDIEARQRKRTFLIAKAGIGAATAAMAIAAIVSAVSTMGRISEQSGNYDKLKAEYQAMQSEAAEYEAALKAEQGGSSEEGKIDKDMYSAKAAGERVAELLNMAYAAGGLDKESPDYEEFRRYCPKEQNTVMFGAGLDPEESPLKWSFLTWYDSTSVDYGEFDYDYASLPDKDKSGKVGSGSNQMLFACTAEENGSSYLLCAVFATYDGDRDTFAFSGARYKTSFGAMYERNGRIEDPDPSDQSLEIGDMAGQLAGESTAAAGPLPASPAHSGGDDAVSGGSAETTAAGTGDPGPGDIDDTGSTDAGYGAPALEI